MFRRKRKFPLHHVVKFGDVHGVKAELRRNTNVNALDKDGRTPLHAAVECGDATIVKVLLDEVGRTPFYQAINCVSESIVKMLLEHNANVNAVDEDGCTSLHLAVSCGCASIVKVLLKHNANVNALDKVGRTPLHQPIHCGSENITKMLLEHNANVNTVDENGCTPLHAAAAATSIYGSDTGRVKLLLDHKANVNAVDKDGESPLHYASRSCKIETAKLLLANGAQVSVRNKAGESADRVCGERPFARKPGEESIKRMKTYLKEVLQREQQQQQQQQQEVERKFADAAEELLMQKRPDCDDRETGMSFTLERTQGNSKCKVKDLQFVSAGNARPSTVISGGPQRQLGKESNQMYATFHVSLATAASAVAKIKWSNGFVGTGWLVGTKQRKFLLTNLHVVDEPPATSRAQEQTRQGERWAEFDFNRPQRPTDSLLTVRFKPPFFGCPVLDVAVLELDLATVMSHSGKALPAPITRFKVLDPNHKTVHLVGHPRGDPKVLDIQCKVIPLAEINRIYPQLQHWSNTTFRADMYPNVRDHRRVSYNASQDFVQGSSGGPGFVKDVDDHASVALIHTIAFPDAPGPLQGVPDSYHFEQGTRIEYVFDLINGWDQTVCLEIFPNGRPF